MNDVKPKFDPNQPFDVVKPKFDPTQPFSDAGAQLQEIKPEESLGRRLVRGTVNTVLPVAGAVGAGLLATPETVGLGTIPAAAGGYAIGKQGARIVNHYLLGDDAGASTPIDLAKQTVGDLGEGAMMEMGGQVAGKVVGSAAKAAAESPIGQKVIQKAGEYGSKLSSSAGNAAAKVGELLTGVPEKEIQTYAKSADEIKAMAKASDNSTADAADQLREKWSGQIQATRKNLNDQISGALKQSQKSVSSGKIIKSLEDAKTNIDTDLYPEQIDQIDDLLKKVKTKIQPNGSMNVNDANSVKRYLQDKASSSYKPNAIFPLGDEAAKAAKSAAAETRSVLNVAEPTIKTANDQLANLHDIEDSMNRNMLKEGKPEASIISAGSGGNPRNTLGLQNLSKATGGTMAADAEKLAAMRTFGSPKLMAADSTGKAAGRMGLAAGVGYLVGNVPGSIIATAMTSPMALRTAIDAGRIGAKELALIAGSAEGKALISRAGIANEVIPQIKSTISDIGNKFSSSSLLKAADKNDAAQKKGPDKWADDGVQKLIKHDNSGALNDPDLVQKIMRSKKGKDLLIRASDLKPGSKAMDKVSDEIKSFYLDGAD